MQRESELLFTCIHQENLRECDRIIFQDLEKVRLDIQEIKRSSSREEGTHLNHTVTDHSPPAMQVTGEDGTKLFAEYFGTLFRKKGLTLNGPLQLLHTNFNDHQTSSTDDDSMNERVFEEYFGTLFRKKGTRLGASTLSLPALRLNNGRNYSETLV